MDCITPSKIAAGLTFDRLLTLTAHPAPEWSVALLLRGPSTITLQAVAEGSQHRLRALPAVSKLWTPGVYRYAVRAVSQGDLVAVEEGNVEILPDIDSMPDGTEVLSHARIVLRNIQAVIEKRATRDQEKYVINNRELWRTPISDLLKLRDTYMAEVRREDRLICGRNPFGPALRVRV